MKRLMTQNYKTTSDQHAHIVCFRILGDQTTKLHLFFKCATKFLDELRNIQTTKLRLSGLYVQKLYIFQYRKQLSLLCKYVYKKVKETTLQNYSFLALI